MNIERWIGAVVLVVAAVPVLAQQPQPGAAGAPAGTSQQTRAAVRRELEQAQKDGSYFAARQEYTPPDAHFISTKTREQVQEELRQAKADGSYAESHLEYVPPDAHFVSTKTRAEVIDELIKSKADGSYDYMHRELYIQ